MMWLAVLVLHPVLEAEGPLRLVAADVGEHDVAWSVDGVEVAVTADREATVLTLPAGAHEVRATSRAAGAWQAMARTDGAAHGAAYVPAWTAVHEPRPSRDGPGAGVPPLPLALGLAAAVLLLWPRRRGLEARRRARQR